MPHVSKNRLDERVLEKIFSLFFEIVGREYNRHEFEAVLQDILAPTERVMIAKRIAIVYLLLKNIDYQIICERLKVSKTTVFKFRLLMEKSGGVVP